MNERDTQFKKDIARQPLGTHLCSIYRTQEEQLAVVIPFLIEGIVKREKIFYIIDESTAKDIAAGFKKYGVDIQTYIQSGRFSILTKEDAYLKGGSFDPDLMIKLLRDTEAQALKEGYAGLRVTGDMTWIFTKLPGVKRLIEYETKLNDFLPSSKSVAVCQYHEDRFDPDILYAVLCTHPITIIHGRLCENHHFLSPEEFLMISRSGKATKGAYERMRDDILDLSKVEAGKMELLPTSFSIRDLLKNSLSFIAEQTMKHNISLLSEFSADVDMIEADERKVKQILFNLLSNAVKFTPDGGSITVGADIVPLNSAALPIKIRKDLPDTQYVLVSVKDTGIGIAKEDQSKLFTEFRQLENPYTKKYEGTGLGLALSKRLVTLHEGEIWFESGGKGKGCTFYFTLPINVRH